MLIGELPLNNNVEDSDVIAYSKDGVHLLKASVKNFGGGDDGGLKYWEETNNTFGRYLDASSDNPSYAYKDSSDTFIFHGVKYPLSYADKVVYVKKSDENVPVLTSSGGTPVMNFYQASYQSLSKNDKQNEILEAFLCRIRTAPSGSTSVHEDDQAIYDRVYIGKVVLNAPITLTYYRDTVEATTTYTAEYPSGDYIAIIYPLALDYGQSGYNNIVTMAYDEYTRKQIIAPDFDNVVTTHEDWDQRYYMDRSFTIPMLVDGLYYSVTFIDNPIINRYNNITQETDEQMYKKQLAYNRLMQRDVPMPNHLGNFYLIENYVVYNKGEPLYISGDLIKQTQSYYDYKESGDLSDSLIQTWEQNLRDLGYLPEDIAVTVVINGGAAYDPGIIHTPSTWLTSILNNTDNYYRSKLNEIFTTYQLYDADYDADFNEKLYLARQGTRNELDSFIDSRDTRLVGYFTSDNYSIRDSKVLKYVDLSNDNRNVTYLSEAISGDITASNVYQKLYTLFLPLIQNLNLEYYSPNLNSQGDTFSTELGIDEYAFRTGTYTNNWNNINAYIKPDGEASFKDFYAVNSYNKALYIYEGNGRYSDVINMINSGFGNCLVSGFINNTQVDISEASGDAGKTFSITTDSTLVYENQTLKVNPDAVQGKITVDPNGPFIFNSSNWLGLRISDGLNVTDNTLDTSDILRSKYGEVNASVLNNKSLVMLDTSGELHSLDSSSTNYIPGKVYYYDGDRIQSSATAVDMAHVYEKKTDISKFSVGMSSLNGKVYAAFTLNSGYFKFDSFTDTLPTTENSKYYIYIGTVGDGKLNLEPFNPVYYYKDNAIRIYAYSTGGGGGTAGTLIFQKGANTYPDVDTVIAGTGINLAYSESQDSGGQITSRMVTLSQGSASLDYIPIAIQNTSVSANTGTALWSLASAAMGTKLFLINIHVKFTASTALTDGVFYICLSGTSGSMTEIDNAQGFPIGILKDSKNYIPGETEMELNISGFFTNYTRNLSNIYLNAYHTSTATIQAKASVNFAQIADFS